MTQHDWQNAFGEADASFRLHLHQTLTKLEDRKMKKRYRLSSVLVAAALMLISLAGGCFAADQLGIFDFFNTADPIVPLEGAEAMVGTNLGSSENEYAVLSVEEAVFDGQGVLIKCRLTPRDGENYALYDDMMQTATDDLYYIERIPAKAAEGRQHWWDNEKEYALINKNGIRKLTVDGVEQPLPLSPDEARERRLGFYEMGDALYYIGYDWNVLGRRDGKTMMGYWIWFSMDDELIFLNTHDAKEDVDGSIVWWASGVADEVLDVDAIEMTVHASVQPEDEDLPLPEIKVTLPRSEEQRVYNFTPDESTADSGIEILSAKIICTRVRAYVRIEYRSPENKAMDVDFSLYSESGQEMKLGAGGSWEENGVYCWKIEMQPLEELSESILLEVNGIGEAQASARFVCNVSEE